MWFFKSPTQAWDQLHWCVSGKLLQFLCFCFLAQRTSGLSHRLFWGFNEIVFIYVSEHWYITNFQRLFNLLSFLMPTKLSLVPCNLASPKHKFTRPLFSELGDSKSLKLYGICTGYSLQKPLSLLPPPTALLWNIGLPDSGDQSHTESSQHLPTPPPPSHTSPFAMQRPGWGTKYQTFLLHCSF